MTQGSSRGSALKAWVRALEAIKFMETSPTASLPFLLEEVARLHGERPALLGEGQHLSYRDLAAQARRYARWAMAQSLAAGDVVCLLMPNCPEYVAIWLGLTRVGCVVALVNTNQVGASLLHSVRTARASWLIVADSLSPAIAAIADQLDPSLRIRVHGGARLDAEIAQQNAAPLDAEACPWPLLRDRALLIYTSGTTGAPKAANVTHGRIVEWSCWFAGMMDVQPDDRLYDCLPMYHSVGGILAIGALLVRGGSVLIRARFSASRFWDDVSAGGCTIFQYIGELCRYLTAAKPHPQERAHRLRLACGNGLAGDVWGTLQQRFGIPQILEFYAATEGSVSLYNVEGKPGAIGRVPPFLAHRFPVILVRCDPQTGEKLRDASGRCVVCGTDEAGEALGRILQEAHAPARQFDGYTDDAASARKVVHDVVEAGDSWFCTGDLMRKDAAGYFYFVDRLGDTFRWKGENVATTEVAAVLRACPGVSDVAVYGVEVAGHEGRAGMAAITTDDRFDLQRLRAHLAAELPAYAQPLFVRQCQTLEMTGTFKMVKAELAKQGFADVADPVWFNDRDTGCFRICDAALLKAISAGTLRL